MTPLSRSLCTLALAAIVGTSATVASSPRLNVSTGLTAAGSPLALRGYDPVSYRGTDGPMPGRADLSVVHEGATYRFSDRANLETFESNPERYLPAFGGFCAYGVSVGAKFDGDPTVWKIVEDRLYLNLNPQIQSTWEKDLTENIRRAQGAWPRILDLAPESLPPGQ